MWLPDISSPTPWIFGLLLAFLFRKPLTRLIDRLRHIQGLGFSVDFGEGDGILGHPTNSALTKTTDAASSHSQKNDPCNISATGVDRSPQA